jgi:hypothetical protein
MNVAIGAVDQERLMLEWFRSVADGIPPADLARLCDAWREGRVAVLPVTGIGDLSDGYHTFNELYDHRAVLFSVICNENPAMAWKSKQHHDGTMYDGMFIVGLETPYGQATYHYDVEPYWAYFSVPVLERAPEWDGHTAKDAINRLLHFGTVKADDMLREAQRWVAVGEIVPPTNEPLLGMVHIAEEPSLGESVWLVQWDGFQWLDDLGHSIEDMGHTVTHYRPLPAPPEVQDE